MKVKINISTDVKEPLVVIHTNAITDEVHRLISVFEQQENIITVNDDEKIIVLKPNEIFMVRIELAEVFVYCQSKKYTSKKRLYELGEQLGMGFMQISKAAFINLKEIDSVEPSFNSMMKLKLKNGCFEYISRKYLPNFKKYLGI